MQAKQELTNFCVELINKKNSKIGIEPHLTAGFDTRESLLKSGILDSFDLVEVVTALENEFAVNVNLDGIILAELSIEKLVNAAIDQNVCIDE